MRFGGASCVVDDDECGAGGSNKQTSNVAKQIRMQDVRLEWLVYVLK